MNKHSHESIGTETVADNEKALLFAAAALALAISLGDVVVKVVDMFNDPFANVQNIKNSIVGYLSVGGAV